MHLLVDSASVTYYGAFHFVDGADAETEYVYDANGNMTQDFNKKISKIEYNSLNLPSMIQYSHGYQAHYGYDAAGRKLSVRHIISPVNIYVPMGSTTLPENAFLEWRGFDVYADNIQYFMEKSLSVFPTRLNFDGGYITSIDDTPVYHYYLQDHLGNNRMVVNTNGEVEQVNHYYAFGGLMGESTGGDTQTYKYNGKELDCINGLDWYDYGARNYDAALGRWHVVDPLAEKYYNVSPYAYGGNNPVNRVDFYGMFPTKYAALDYAKAQNVDFRNVRYANDRKEWYVSFGEDGKGYKSGGTLERRFSERLVDTKEWSTIGNFNSGIGTGASLIDFNFGKALKRSTAYIFYDNTGRYLSSIKPSVKFNNISYEFNPKVISRIAKTANRVSIASGLISVGMTGYEIYEKKKNIIGEGGLDLIMTGVGYISPYGWVVSGAYFLGKYGMEELNIDFWNK